MTVYLEKNRLAQPQIEESPQNDLEVIIVIPAYNEKYILSSIKSIFECTAPGCSVEIIVVINDSQSDDQRVKDQNKKTEKDLILWASSHNKDRIKVFPVYFSNLSPKKAGVGLARKLGMDEAVHRFSLLGKEHTGVIVCFDADTFCLKNYLQSIQQAFNNNPKLEACNLYFEHPYDELEVNRPERTAIVQYELHLRYFIQVQRWSGFPFAYHTVGSAMAVRAGAYQAQGGMNQRKAGEDFYFLHKFTCLDTFGQILNTKVIPSPRVSNRVPFGTGKAVGDIIRSGRFLNTYSPQTFEELKNLFNQLDRLYFEKNYFRHSSSEDSVLYRFLIENNFEGNLEEIKNNVSSLESFKKRFFKWFNAFRIMKFAHFARDNGYPNIPVEEAAKWLLEKNAYPINLKNMDSEQLLIAYRELDRNG